MRAGEEECYWGHFLGALDKVILVIAPGVEQDLKALLFVVSESGKGE